MTISLHTKKCCKLPALENTTLLADSSGIGNCSGLPVAPYTRLDIACEPVPHPCCGAWPARAVQTFGAKSPPFVIKNDCDAGGQKLAVARGLWPGRYGFVDDYILNPKVPTHFKQYKVDTTFGEFSTGTQAEYSRDDGSLVATGKYDTSNTGTASSTQRLTVGGVLDCIGAASAEDGSATCENSQYGDRSCSVCIGNNNSGIGLLQIPADTCAYPTEPDRVAARDYNAAFLKSWCAINGDRSNITIAFPELGSYSGPAGGLAAWVTRLNYDTGVITQCNEVDGKEDHWSSYTAALESFSLANDSITGTVTLTIKSGLKQWTAQFPGCVVRYLIYEEENTYKYTFNFTVTLSDIYTFGQAVSDTISLSHIFDLTKEEEFPFTKPEDCRTAPMADRWALNGSPGFGYCDTPADPAQTAIYDGSVRGALMNYYTDPSTGKPYKVGFYDKGWFDLSLVSYHYDDNGSGDCNERLCYNYGAYPSERCDVTMATQLTTGSFDTSGCGPGWSPFTRYYVNYVLPIRPPFVDASCGFIADGGDAIYVGKYCERKVPLKSQNFFGPCGEMRSATLLDAHCNATATLRWPTAWSICGKVGIASMGIGGGVVTVNLSAEAPALVTGDAVDFLDASNGVTTANVTVTVDSPTQFHFTGALPTGVAVKSHGAPNPDWYNVAPKGDFVWAFRSGNVYDGTDTVTAQQDNLFYGSGWPYKNTKKAIMAVCPPGSPEINNPKWPSAYVHIVDTYPLIEPGGHWFCIPVQAMRDRFFTDKQDNSMNDGDTPPGACTRLVPPPSIPLVEAVLFAPSGAPFDFSGGDGNAYNKLPLQTEVTNFRCSGIWNATDQFSALPYSTWPGVSTGVTPLASQDVPVVDTGDVLGLGAA